jgi:cell pole-organizing protein PopZ
MNRPDKAGEPSMEEILASIRQIIADEPRNEQTDSVDANPLVPQSRTSKSPEAPLPLADRLSGVLKSGPLAPTSPFGSKRPLSFDQDLADMFDETEGTSNSGVAAPKPDIRVPTELSHPMATKPFVEKDHLADTSSDDARASPSASAQPIIPPPPVAGLENAAEPAAAPAASPFGFPPLRKSSFYPPQASTPLAASAPSAASQSDPVASSSPSEPILASPPGAAPVTDAPSVPPQHVAEALRRLESGASLTADAAPADEPSGSWPPEPVAKPEPLNSVRDTASTASALSSRASFSSSFHAAAKPSVAASTEADPILAPLESPPPPFSFGADTSAEAKRGPTFDGILREPSSAARQMPEHKPFNGNGYDSRSFSPAAKETSAFSDPFGPSVRAAPVSAGNSRFETGPSLRADAAHQALDALALGLAASAAGVTPPSPQPEPLANAIPLTPVLDIPSPPRHAEPEAHTQPVPASAPVAPQPSTLPAPVANAGSMPVTRSLEDAVADMLRPMLQQWVADNMPRIIERALRNEVASALKPGQKPGS